MRTRSCTTSFVYSSILLTSNDEYNLHLRKEVVDHSSSPGLAPFSTFHRHSCLPPLIINTSADTLSPFTPIGDSHFYLMLNLRVLWMNEWPYVPAAIRKNKDCIYEKDWFVTACNLSRFPTIQTSSHCVLSKYNLSTWYLIPIFKINV